MVIKKFASFISLDFVYFYIMKYLIYIFILLICGSCRQDNFQKINAEEIVDKELKSINFSEVDQFPLFKTCDETASRQAQKACFEQELHKWLKPHLDSIPYQNIKKDSINLHLSIHANGKISLDSLSSKSELVEIFHDIFNHSPKIYPAQKRGVPVKVSFQLPVILKVESD